NPVLETGPPPPNWAAPTKSNLPGAKETSAVGISGIISRQMWPPTTQSPFAMTYTPLYRNFTAKNNPPLCRRITIFFYLKNGSKLTCPSLFEKEFLAALKENATIERMENPSHPPTVCHESPRLRATTPDNRQAACPRLRRM